MYIVAGLMFGGLVGWIASLWLKAATNEEIILDVAVGAAGGTVLAQLLGNQSVFDSSLAGCLGAMLAVGAMQLVRRLPRGR